VLPNLMSRLSFRPASRWPALLLLAGCVVAPLEGHSVAPHSPRSREAASPSAPARAAAQATPPAGIVRVEGRALVDDGGPFFAVGATYFAALWFLRHDRARLERDLAFLSARGIDFVRVLGEVGGDWWKGREADPRWEDYDRLIAELTDLAYDRYGMRVQWTLFGELEYSTSKEARLALADRFAAMAKARPHKIVHFEIANEFWQTGFHGPAGLQELRELTGHLQRRLRDQGTPVPVAASAPGPGHRCQDWRTVYEGLGADIATIHFERDVASAEGHWRPVRRPWEYAYCEGMPEAGSNNEPIGPGSSVADDSDPLRLVMAAVVTFVSGLPLYVLHTDAGVRGDLSFADTPHIGETLRGLAAIRNYLPPDVTQGRRENAHWAGHPLELRSPVWPEGGQSEGLVRAYATVLGDSFVVTPIGVRGRVAFAAKRPMRLEVIHPLTGDIQQTLDLGAGQAFELSGLPAFVLRGQWK
jgi:hypothetical protein